MRTTDAQRASLGMMKRQLRTYEELNSEKAPHIEFRTVLEQVTPVLGPAPPSCLDEEDGDLQNAGGNGLQ